MPNMAKKKKKELQAIKTLTQIRKFETSILQAHKAQVEMWERESDCVWFCLCVGVSVREKGKGARVFLVIWKKEVGPGKPRGMSVFFLIKKKKKLVVVLKKTTMCWNALVRFGRCVVLLLQDSEMCPPCKVLNLSSPDCNNVFIMYSL